MKAIRALDVGDDAATAAWHAAYHRAYVFEQEHPVVWDLQELRAELTGARTGRRLEAYAGYVGGAPVVVGVLDLPLLDNLEVAHVSVATGPADRRRGHGTAMLEHLTARASDRGRRTLLADASWDYEAPADGAGTAGADFLTGHGFAFSLGDVKRVLDLPVDEHVLDRLARDAAVHHAAYALRHWAGPVPEDVVDVFGSLVGSLMTEAPQGDLDLEEEVFDAARIRADEKVLEASGRTKYTTVAVTGDGEPVAYSELAVSAGDRERAFQWGTLVRPAHRGHRLGLATKVHNLRRLQQREPGRVAVVTWNAEVNRPMIAVNEAIGFRPVGRLGEFQKRL